MQYTIQNASDKTGVPVHEIEMGVWPGTVDSISICSGRFIAEKGMEQLKEIANK